MSFSEYDFLFEMADLKILFYKHDCFYTKRGDFIGESNMKEKEQVGCLHDSHQFIIVLMDLKGKKFHLIGAKTEDEARALTKSVQLANRYQEMNLMALEFQIDLNPNYLNWIVQTCNNGVKFFDITFDMIKTNEDFLILKHFISQCDLIENLSFRKYKMTKEEIDLITGLIVTLPQTQIKGFKFKSCNFTDDDLPDIGRAIKHNGYLEYLSFEDCNITDKSLRFFSGLWQYVPFLEYFGLTHCPKVKGEIYFSSFLERMVSELQLKILNLSHNSLTEKIIEFLIEEVFSVKNASFKVIDLSYNDITPRENLNMFQFFQDSLISKKCQLIIERYPINGYYFSKINNKQKVLTLELERIGIHRKETKRLILTKREKARAKELREELNMSILNRKSIEQIHKLCSVIDKQPFDYPPQYVEEGIRFIRDTMTSADDLGDYYGFYYAEQCSKMLGMNQKDIKLKKDAIQNRTDSYTQELTRLLNFQIPETQANIILDELVDKAIKRDYRGDAIDLLFYLKSLRDHQTNTLLYKKTDAVQIEMHLMQKDPFFSLNYDKEFSDVCREYAKHSKTPTDCLGYHHQWVDYSEITKLTKKEIKSIINIEQEKSEKARTKVNTYRHERAMFLLSDLGSDEFEAGQDDKLLLITRAIIRYKYYKKPHSKEKRSVEDKVRSIAVDENPSDLGISNIDSKPIDSDLHSLIEGKSVKKVESKEGGISEVISVKSKSDISRNEKREVKSDNVSAIGPEDQKLEKNEEQKLKGIIDDDEKNSSVELTKLPFSISPTDYKIALKINTLIIKICRLNFEIQSAIMVVSL